MEVLENVGIKGWFWLLCFITLKFFFQCKIFKVSLSSKQMFDNKFFLDLKQKPAALPLIHIVFFF